ncbi:MAG TPA: condensation domain-containing protein [Candidatus Baltobacteraceae bacterium]|nr:condensation domain-containing protein [Candidatus Baltobacteraceae bacterium]
MPERWYPLSYSQRDIWNHWKRHRLGSEYNTCLLVRFSEPVDASALRRAFACLVDGHESLRTTYHERNGEMLQCVGDRDAAAFETVDALGWDVARLEREVAQRAYRPIDLEVGPAFYGTFFSRPRGGDALLLVAHHILLDNWGGAFIFERFGALYASALRLKPDEALVAEREPVTYGSFAERQCAMLASPAGERLARFWKRELAAPLPAPLPPTDRPRRHPPIYDAATERFVFDEAFVGKINAFAKGVGLSVYRVLLAAFFALLHQRYGQQDVIVATQLLARSPEYRDVLGYFVATGFIRERVAPGVPFAELCKRIGKRVDAFYEHQDYPLPALLERLGRDAAADPIAPVLFTYQRSRRTSAASAELAGTPSMVVGSAPFSFGGTPCTSHPMPKREIADEFHAMLEEIDGALHCRFTYRRELWNAATVAGMVEEYRAFLDGAILEATASQPG